jgi:hypothetical protein
MEIIRIYCNLIGSCCGGRQIPMILEFLQCPIRFASGLFAYVLLSTFAGRSKGNASLSADRITLARRDLLGPKQEPQDRAGRPSGERSRAGVGVASRSIHRLMGASLELHAAAQLIDGDGFFLDREIGHRPSALIDHVLDFTRLPVEHVVGLRRRHPSSLLAIGATNWSSFASTSLRLMVCVLVPIDWDAATGDYNQPACRAIVYCKNWVPLFVPFPSRYHIYFRTFRPGGIHLRPTRPPCGEKRYV